MHNDFHIYLNIERYYFYYIFRVKVRDTAPLRIETVLSFQEGKEIMIAEVALHVKDKGERKNHPLVMFCKSPNCQRRKVVGALQHSTRLLTNRGKKFPLSLPLKFS